MKFAIFQPSIAFRLSFHYVQLWVVNGFHNVKSESTYTCTPFGPHCKCTNLRESRLFAQIGSENQRNFS